MENLLAVYILGTFSLALASFFTSAAHMYADYMEKGTEEWKISDTL
jgi:hypothetical protein